MKDKSVPLYAMTCFFGGQWTVVFRPQGSYSAQSLTGYGEFPRDRFPGIPHIDMRPASKVLCLSIAEAYSAHIGSDYVPLARALEMYREAGATVN